MKAKIVFSIGVIMFTLGMFFSTESNFMLITSIVGGGLVGYSSKAIHNRK